MKLRNVSKRKYIFGKGPEDVSMPGCPVEMPDAVAIKHLKTFPRDFACEENKESLDAAFAAYDKAQASKASEPKGPSEAQIAEKKITEVLKDASKREQKQK